MQRITGLPDEQVLAYEAQAEAAMRAALERVMDIIARRIEASMPVLASVLVAADGVEDAGDIIPPSEVPAGDGLPPGQPYVSPDDLASIPPLWQTAVEQQILPIVAQVFLDAAGRTYAGMVEASSIAGLPSVGSLAAERYLAQAQNTFEQVGDDLWATARTELSDGFERGESIPQLAERLRASAGVTARTGVLVARTQVNEASNAGSFATAQASGLKMQKEWIATPDLRTRPTHLAADGQRVDLNEPFIVGGFSAMYPAAPSLPPSMRFNCRCSIGYVMPDRAITQMRESLAQQNEQEQLPGTEGPLTIFHPKPAEPGAEVGPLLPEPVVDPRAIRLAYRQAKTSDELRAAWQDEMRRITSRDIIVQMPPGASVLTMRQYAEGVTQMLERFPEARLRKVSWWSDGTTGDYARIARGSATIEFNAYWAADVHRAEYLRALRHDVSGWTGPEKSGWSVRGASTPQATAYHEFAHILDIETLSDGAKFRALDIATRRAVVRGVGRDELIASDVSAYATSNGNELIAEAITDVMVNGQRASAASREIYDLIVADYKARGLAVRTTTHVADELTDEEIAALFPKPRDPLAVRPVLEAARTTTAVERAFTAEFERITGRRARSVSFAGSAATAREHAEGLLRGLERFPDAKLDLITAANIREKVSYAQTVGSRIDFSYEWTSPAARKKYLDSLAGDVAGWDLGIREFGLGIFRSSAWHPRGTGNPIAVALHEFGHVLDIETTMKAIRPELEKLLRLRTAEAKRLGRLAPETPIIDQEDLIFREISSYATKNDRELVAEAFSDVMMNGQAASALSREIFDLLEAEYKRGGGVVRAVSGIGETLPSRAGEIFPKAPAPKMKPVTVARGKDLTGDEELAVRAQREAEREHVETPIGDRGVREVPPDYQGDYAFHEIAKAQGFNGLPRIVADDDQWRRLLDEGDYIPLYRGHGWAGGDGVAQVDAFNYGERYVGGGFAPGNNMSPDYMTARHYANGHDSAVGRYALRSDAKVVTYPDLKAERDAYVAGLPVDSVERTLYEGNLGLGRFGTAKGYDAMVVPRAETGLTERVEEWVIFNRTKIVAYDDSAKGVAAARAGGKAVPAKITAGERARRAKDEAVTAARSVGHLTRELDQMIAEGGDEAFRSGALWRRIRAQASRLGTPPAVRQALLRVASQDQEGASLEALRVAIDKANLDAGVRRIGAAGDVVRFDARRDQTWGLADDVTVADGDLVTVRRPGSVIEYQGKPLQIAAPRVRPATPQEIAASPTAPTVVAPAAAKNLSTQTVAQLRALAKERGIAIPAGARKADLVKALSEPTPVLDEKALLRAAARERNRLIESSQGTAKLLAEVDELIANKATKAAIRQRLDPALIAPEQVYAGADPAIVDALRKALDTGDPAKLRSALTRAGTKAKLKPVSKAGAKATFDAETMEGVGGIEIAPGAQVTVVRRGTTLTLPDGSTMQLTRAQVTPIVPKPAPVKAIIRATPRPAAAAQIEEHVKTGVARVESMPGGKNATTELVTFNDGTQAVRKTMRAAEGQSASAQADAEEMAARMLRAFGIRAPETYRAGAKVVYQERLVGTSAKELPRVPGSFDVAGGYYESDEGRVIGLVDALMDNYDRNAGNWMVGVEGEHLGVIDHGFAFQWGKNAPPSEAPFSSMNPFDRHLSKPVPNAGEWAANDYSPADLATARRILDSMRPEFERLGHTDWYDKAVERLGYIEQHATGTKIRIKPLAPVKAIKAIKRAPTKAVARQAAIDEARQVGDLAAEVLELSNNGASVAALRSRITNTAKRLGTPDEVRDALLEVTSRTGDVLRAQALQQLERAGITPTGTAGQVVKFDRKIHDPIAGVKAGDLVIVDRPGLTFTRDGEKIQLAKAKVGPAPKGSTVPLTSREFDAKIKTAAKKQEALGSVPSGLGEHFEDLAPAQQRAIISYQGTSFESVNDSLRGVKQGSAHEGRQIRDIDEAMDGSRTGRDVELWRSPGSGRGIFGDPATWGDDLSGFEWRDDAYSSTSAAQSVADRFNKDGGVRLRILAPKGTKAIRLSDMPTAGLTGDQNAEAEVLLGRGAQYRVVRDHGWTTIAHPARHQRIRVRDLDVEVVVPDETPPLPWATK